MVSNTDNGIPSNQNTASSSNVTINAYGWDSDMISKIKTVLRDELNRSGVYG